MTALVEKLITDKMHQKFEKNLPDTLYKSHYALAEELGGSPIQWKNYLKNPDTARFIEMELASITESAARAALKNLSGGASSSDIAAAKQLLENSKLLQQKHNPKQHIILTYLPKRGEKDGEMR